MSEFRGYEFYGVTGLPVVGATAEVWDAVDGVPGGSPIATTTTTANGRWEFLGLTESPKDVKLTFTGRVRWYKGLVKAGFDRLLVGSGGLTLTNFTVTGVFTSTDPILLGQVTITTGVVTLPTATGNTGKWRFLKAGASAITVTPFSGQALQAPGATAASGTNVTYTQPPGESVGWYCNGTIWVGI